jgi:hypothetical protein
MALYGGAIILLRVGLRLDGYNGLGVGWQLVLLLQAILGSQRLAGQTGEEGSSLSPTTALVL